MINPQKERKSILKPLMVANWKMHKTITESIEFLNDFKNATADVHEVDIVICPPFISLPHAGQMLKGSNIHLGGQNMFYEDKGAFTGEISPRMLKEIGCTYVIIGHSERRRWFFEPGLVINKKVKKALSSGIFPIMCVGETEQERDSKETNDVIARQLTEGLEGISADDMPHITIGYEPIWAIGTGKTATPEIAQKEHSFIRSWLANKYGQMISESVRILYGGSVTPENVKELMAQPDINGGLVGTASLDPESFTDIVRFFE